MFVFALSGLFFILAIGVLLHFCYGIAKNNKFLALIFPASSSVWDHTKTAILPAFIWAIVMICLKVPNAFFACFVGILALFILLPSLFYVINLITKKETLVGDICAFVLSTALSMFISYLLFKTALPEVCKILGIVGLLLLVFVYVIFVFFTPKGFIFDDPSDN